VCFGENKGFILHTFASKTKVSNYKLGMKSEMVTFFFLQRTVVLNLI